MTPDLTTSLFLLAFVVCLTNIASALWAIARALRELREKGEETP